MTPKNTPEINTDIPELLEELTDELFEEQFEKAYPEQILESHDMGACNTELRTAIRLYDNPDIALLFMCPDYTVVYYTACTAQLFNGYYSLAKKPFFNIFRQALDQDQLRELNTSLRSEESGYAWTGTLKHKNLHTKTMYTKTNIIPIFSEIREVSGFLVLFEDITIRYISQLRATFSSILEAAKLKDNDTGLHNERVNHYSRKMAEHLYSKRIYPQIDLDFIDSIGFLAAMHDVGKIGTPDYILQKPGPLSELEWDIMREHTVNGTFILASYPDPMAKEIALSHHEWWNGNGYPFKLEGNMIPLAARIVTIADVYDALRMKRSYKNEFSHENAIEKIVASRGSHFDPLLIDELLTMHEDFEDIWTLMHDTDAENPTDHDRINERPEAL